MPGRTSPTSSFTWRQYRDGLTNVDPDGQAIYEANAAAYLAKLDALDAEIRALIDSIPKENRRIITSHDAFRYFGPPTG